MDDCICRLCQQQAKLKESHIVSKMFYNVVKKKSPTGIMRQASEPNKSEQDGLKLPFLCEKCEELFSKYERYFSNNLYTQTILNDGEISFKSNDAKIAYFTLSLAWRVAKHTMEFDKTTFTEEEKAKTYITLDMWRTLLLNEQLDEIKKCQQFVIPTKNIIFFDTIKERITNNVMMDMKTMDKENEFNFAYTIIQVPYFIFVTTLWGTTDAMKSYSLYINQKIKPRKSQLPQCIINSLINNHITEFNKATDKLTAKQKSVINNRVKKSTNK